MLNFFLLEFVINAHIV